MSVITNEPIDAYHACTALSNSKINIFRTDGPQAYYRQFIARTMERPDSDAFRFGRMFDDRLFLSEPDWRARYCVRPEGLDGRTKEGKAWLAEHASQTCIKPDEAELMHEMMGAIDNNALARGALSGGQAQVTIRRALSGLSVTVQSRPDYLKPGVIVDLKTTADLALFDRNCVAYGYHRQLCLAQWLLAQEGQQCEALLVVVEKKIAGRCRVRRIPETVLAAGWESIKGDIAEIARRMSANDWTDAQAEIEDVQVPTWQMRQLEAASA